MESPNSRGKQNTRYFLQLHFGMTDKSPSQNTGRAVEIADVGARDGKIYDQTIENIVFIFEKGVWVVRE